jgi:multiple sugar transport system ATP-binding protein
MGRVKLQDVEKTYETKGERLTAVSDLNIEVDDGEFLVLVGPSGCGKSSTLRMIAGLESITDGTLKIGDEVMNNKKPKERDIAMVFQNYALYPHKTVRENMGFGLKYSSSLSQEEIKKKVHNISEMMGISELLDEKPGQLSGGQKQRVALGRAIVREPSVFLLDEPLSNLDAKLRTHMRTEITRLQNELDITTIYVTHDQAEAMTMGDRIAVLNNGELQQIGTPNEVYRHPANRFVAGFIGSPSMNFVDMTAKRNGGELSLVANHDETVNYAIGDLDSSLPIQVGDEITLGVRPEDLQVGDQTPEISSEYQIRGAVKVIEPMGSDNFLSVDIGLPNENDWIVRADPSYSPEINSQINLTFSPHSMSLFRADGKTIKSKGDATTSTHMNESRPAR